MDNQTNPRPTKKEGDDHDNLLCINKAMLPCKLINLIKDGSVACYWQFLSLFFVTSGLTVAQFGLINGIGSIFQLIFNPLWGVIIDSISRHRMLLFTFLCVIPTMLQFWSPWLVKIVGRYETVVTYSDNMTLVLNSTSQIDHSRNYTISERLVNQNSLFVVFAINNVIASIFISGMCGYIEGSVVKRVFTSKSGQSYGEQKLYGPIGYAVGSFLTGVAVDHFIPAHLSRYTAAFWLFLLFSLLCIPISNILNSQVDWEYGKTNPNDEIDKEASLVKDVLKVFLNIDNALFLLTVFVSGVAITIHESYLYIYMFEKMKPSEIMLSLTTVVATISELIVYPFSAKIIKMSGSPIRCILFGLLMFGIRLVVLSYCTAPWQVLLNQLLRGPTLSLPYAAVVEHTWIIFPKQCTTTAMGIISNVYFTASGILTSILGGYFYNRWGGESLFRGGAIVSVVWGLFALLFFEMRRKNLKSWDNPPPTETGTMNSICAIEDETYRV